MTKAQGGEQPAAEPGALRARVDVDRIELTQPWAPRADMGEAQYVAARPFGDGDHQSMRPGRLGQPPRPPPLQARCGHLIQHLSGQQTSVGTTPRRQVHCGDADEGA